MANSQQVELQKINEKSLFTDEKKTKEVDPGCCRNKHTKNCCIATGIIGALILTLGRYKFPSFYLLFLDVINFLNFFFHFVFLAAILFAFRNEVYRVLTLQFYFYFLLLLLSVVILKRGQVFNSQELRLIFILMFYVSLYT